MNIEKYIEIHPNVKKALDNNKAVVALESTIISHGMPYPQNFKTALNVEKIIKNQGAVPATIAILNGKIKIGLNKEEIKQLSKEGTKVMKVSRRDVALCVTEKINGATTVASTMLIAQMAKIKVFATGGIGGVHRGAQSSMDISADLDELAQTNVAVVCAGAKLILDLALTLEYLETKGVPVWGYKTKELPAFYTIKSGFEVTQQINSAFNIAKALKIKWDLKLNGGVVIANPIPKEFAMDYDVINKAVKQAVYEAQEKNITGKETTPFLLAKIKEITGGKSLKSNIELVYNNAKLASDIAIELSKLY